MSSYIYLDTLKALSFDIFLVLFATLNELYVENIIFLLLEVDSQSTGIKISKS